MSPADALPHATAGLPDAFSAPTRAWFSGAFAAPTAAQAGAWQAIPAGEHALVVAPTGSGKTLAAFLWALDGLLTAERGTAPLDRCRVVYVSPLKALAADVDRNLRSPLTGIRQAAARMGHAVADVRVGVRTGDTPAHERRAFGVRPPDILITTPESLFLILTSAARAGLAGVHTVIVDEVHALAGTKRGAHLAVSLERLDELVAHPVQRIGLSATVNPVATVAQFLTGTRTPADGGRDVRIVQPPADKRIEVDVVVPVPDLADLSGVPDRTTAGTAATAAADAATGAAGAAPAGGTPAGRADDDGGPRRASVWPHVEERVVDLVAAHRSTLVFTNSRRGAERLTARMNEEWAGRNGAELPDPGALQPAHVPAQSGTAVGTAPVLARAHHGSMSRAERTRTEEELKAGTLPAVVATSSLELGIDMGAVDLVVQVGSPPSVASGLQRIGRAGHQVGAVSRGVVFPTHRGELLPAAVIAERMRRGAIEPLRIPTNPLDVLAQQIVAMVAMDDWEVHELAAVVRRAAPFATLGDATLHAVLDMLAGRYPSEDFAELRARLVWDRATDVLTARPGAARLATTSGGTIPDRGLYGVFLASGSGSRNGTGDGSDAAVTVDAVPRGGRRVGELDEEMVYESRVGDTFTLGSSTWRIEDITVDRVLVSPAPGVPGRLPFWKGDTPGRPAELGRAIGAWTRELLGLDDGTPSSPARERLTAAGLDEWAADNTLEHLREQRSATGHVPDDRTVVIERFRDEIGDWRVVVHTPLGARVHAPWALVLAERVRERFGVDAIAMHADDGIVLRLPDVTDPEASWDRPTGAVPDPSGEGPALSATDLLIDPENVHRAVRGALGGSAMFAARFREAAARALLLPRRRPDRRQPLWQQRQRAAQLLSVAADYPDFPIVLEAARETLQDDFDVAALRDLMTDIEAQRVRVVEVSTPAPSPFARSLLFGYTAQFLYDGDAPLAERRAAALTLDPDLLAELLGQDGAGELADLLDPEAVLRTEAELSWIAPERQARTVEDVADMVRRIGPLTPAAIVERTQPTTREQVPAWLTSLERDRRLLRVRLGGVPAEEAEQWCAVEDAGRLRDALGVALPVGVPEAFTEPVADPLGDLVTRHARSHGPFTAAALARRFGVGSAVVAEVLQRLESRGRLVSGRLRPESLGGAGVEFCDPDVLRTIRRRSLAALRAEVEPVPQQTLGVFLPRWHGVGRLRGVDGVLRAVEQLTGAVLPASALETHVLPARVVDYSPVMLDELTASGVVLWRGHPGLASSDGMVSLHLAESADLTLPPPLQAETLDSPVHRAVLEVLGHGGALFLAQLTEAVAEVLAPDGPDDAAELHPGAVLDAVWDLVWAGHLTNDTFTPVRDRSGVRPTHRTARPRPPRARHLTRARLRGLRPAGAAPVRGAGGRWSLLPAVEPDPTVRTHALAHVLLDRHGVLTRAVAPAEGVGGQFPALYRVLTALEEAGQVRRGYFVEHLGGSQFALPGAVDRLRDDAREAQSESRRLAQDARDEVVLLAATDPANPYGAALAWPDPPGDRASGHRPGRKAGAVVVLVAGDLVLFVERGGRSVLSYGEEPATLAAAAEALAGAVRARRMGRLTVQRIDGVPALHHRGPVAEALLAAGFAPTPRGLRLGGPR